MIPQQEDVLSLKKTEQTFRFPGIEPGTIVSLGRDFSAPIYLDYPLSQADSIALLRHGT